MLTKILVALAWVLAAILFLLGVRTLHSRRRGPVGVFLGLVGLFLTLWSPRPAASDPVRGTSLALARLLVAQDVDWAATGAWKAVVEFWDASEVLDGTGRAASQEEIDKLRADADAVLGDLETLVAEGAIPAATVEAARTIIDRQVWHINRQRATCYKPMGIGHRRLNDLQRRVALLERLREGGKVDPWLYERAMEGLTRDMDTNVPDRGTRKQLQELVPVAMEHALVVQRLLDERRLAVFLSSPEWRALRADLTPLFKGRGLPEAVGAGLAGALQPQVAAGNLSAGALLHLDRIVGLAGTSKPLDAVLAGLPSRSEGARTKDLRALAALAWEGWGGETGFRGGDDPELLFQIAEVYDLLRSLAPER
ncbi:MAG: hypothetical protein ABIK09_01430 [Pseudomonadota bacterium]